MPKYTFSLYINEKGKAPQFFRKNVEFDYHAENFAFVERLVRDTAVELAGKFIEEEFYKKSKDK